MNLLLLLLSSACLWIFSWTDRSVQYYVTEDAPIHFKLFMKRFNKQYVNDNEKAFRYQIFKKNLQIINRSNNESSHAVFGVNRFTDMTSDEFIKTHTGFVNDRGDRSNVLCKVVKDIPSVKTPDELDWRSHNVVTEVKDQKNCGCCYAFSATGLLEAQFALKTGMLLDLSEQQLVDCDFISHGCSGGLTTASLSELMRLGGSMLTTVYPYKAARGKCKSKQKNAVLTLESCYRYILKSPDKLKELLASFGPVSVSIKADSLKEYHYGILDDVNCSPGEINHAVLLVGYGSENTKNYWTFKNSWGKDYGEGGYFRLQRSEHRNGSLGMLNFVVAASIK